MRAIAAFVVALMLGVLAVWAVRVLPHSFTDAWRSGQTAEQVARQLDGNRATFVKQARSAVARADDEARRLANATPGELDRAEQAVRVARRQAEDHRLSGTALAGAAVRSDSAAIMANYKAELIDLPLLDRTEAILAERHRQLRLTDLNDRIADFNRRATAQRAFRQAILRRRQELRARWGYLFCAMGLPSIGCQDSLALARYVDQFNRTAAKLRSERRTLGASKAAQEAARVIQDSGALLKGAVARYDGEARQRAAEAGRHLWIAVLQEFRTSGLWVTAVVTAGLLLPLLGRLTAFLLLAPLAARAAPLRLATAGAPSALVEAAHGLEVPVTPGVDLYLREGASGGTGGTHARTVASPLGRRLLTGWSAGLFGWQRVRRDLPGIISVGPAAGQATHLAAIVVPEGGALVLDPRAVVGLLVPHGAALRIRREARWLDARSWARFQFRFHLFAGPGTVLLQGRHGVHQRPAEAGWAQDARLVVAFDAHLGWGAARRGSLWRFLRGRQSMLDDRFAGDGHVYAEHHASRAIAPNPTGQLLQWIGGQVLNLVGL